MLCIPHAPKYTENIYRQKNCPRIGAKSFRHVLQEKNDHEETFKTVFQIKNPSSNDHQIIHQR
jgi:hypothetical protein